jgi:hypothetical protein
MEGLGIVCLIDITLSLQDDDIVRPLISGTLDDYSGPSNNHSSSTPGESGMWKNRSSTSPRTHIHPTESHLTEGTYILTPRLSSFYYTAATYLILFGILVVPRSSIKHHHRFENYLGL